jgi:hypothetical protein
MYHPMAMNSRELFFVAEIARQRRTGIHGLSKHASGRRSAS